MTTRDSRLHGDDRQFFINNSPPPFGHLPSRRGGIMGEALLRKRWVAREVLYNDRKDCREKEILCNKGSDFYFRFLYFLI